MGPVWSPAIETNNSTEATRQVKGIKKSAGGKGVGEVVGWTHRSVTGGKEVREVVRWTRTPARRWVRW